MLLIINGNNYQGIIGNSNLKCEAQTFRYKTTLRESVFVDMKWIIFKSKGTAKIYFQNEVDQEKAVNLLNEKEVDNVKLLLNKNFYKDKKKQYAIHLQGLNKLTDEEDIKTLLYGEQFFSEPKIDIFREQCNDSNFILEKYNNSFNDFLSTFGLYQYLNKTIFDSHKCFLTASFQVGSQKDGQYFINKFDGQIGIIGEQKVRVKCKNQRMVFVKNDIFQILQNKFCILQDQLFNKYQQYKLNIKLNQKHQQKQNQAIFIQSIDHQINFIVAKKIYNLFFEGIELYGMHFILKNMKNNFQQILNKYQGKIYYQFSNNKYQIFASDEISEKNFFQDIQLLQQKVKERKEQKRQLNKDKNIIYCEICYEEQKNPFRLNCGHKACKECLIEYLEQNLINNQQQDGIVCPLGQCGKIKIQDLQQILEEKFDQFCQKAIKNNISMTDKIKYCFTPDCPYYFYYDSQNEITCKECGEIWCLKQFINKQNIKAHSAHEGNDCQLHLNQQQQEQDFEKLIIPIGKEITKQDIKNANNLMFRRCPFCQIPIEHRYACFHMTCSKCATHFCFLCGKQFLQIDIYGHLDEKHGGCFGGY